MLLYCGFFCFCGVLISCAYNGLVLFDDLRFGFGLVCYLLACFMVVVLGGRVDLVVDFFVWFDSFGGWL